MIDGRGYQVLRDLPGLRDWADAARSVGEILLDDQALRDRCGAHMDGLHLEHGRRILREPHAFVLGVSLSDVGQSPLVIWEGSHEIMRDALAGTAMGGDVTEAYKAARTEVFARCEAVPMDLRLGEAVLMHRLAVHGIAPWQGEEEDPRLMAYFRPQFAEARDWTERRP